MHVVGALLDQFQLERTVDHHAAGRGDHRVVQRAAALLQRAGVVRDVVQSHREGGSRVLDPAGDFGEARPGRVGVAPEQPVGERHVHHVARRKRADPRRVRDAHEHVAARLGDRTAVPDDAVLLRPDDEVDGRRHRPANWR